MELWNCMEKGQRMRVYQGWSTEELQRQHFLHGLHPELRGRNGPGLAGVLRPVPGKGERLA